MSGSSRPGVLRAAGILLLFAAGVVAGDLAWFATHPDPAPPGIPAAPAAPEPAVGAALRGDLAAGDTFDLAAHLDETALTALRDALVPVAEVATVTFAGAMLSGDDTLAAYLVSGTASGGSPAIAAYVLRVRDARIVRVE